MRVRVRVRVAIRARGRGRPSGDMGEHVAKRNVVIIDDVVGLG